MIRETHLPPLPLATSNTCKVDVGGFTLGCYYDTWRKIWTTTPSLRMGTTSMRTSCAYNLVLAKGSNRRSGNRRLSLAGEGVDCGYHALRGGALVACSCALQILSSLAVDLVNDTRREAETDISSAAILPDKDIVYISQTWAGQVKVPALVRARNLKGLSRCFSVRGRCWA